MYFHGLFTLIILSTYSIVKNIVSIHSITYNERFVLGCRLGMLSHETAMMLRTIMIRSTISNSFPSKVSASKIISWMRFLRDPASNLYDIFDSSITKMKIRKG